MRYSVATLAIAIFFTSCNNKKSSEETKSAKSDTTVVAPADTADKKVDVDVPAGGIDQVGGLVLNLVDNQVIALLGQPDSKSKEVEWGADGLMHQDWIYQSKGLTLNMSRNKTAQQIFSIIVSSPSDLKTPKGIGIGSTYDDVIKAYDKEINKEESTDDVVVVGSIYGGVIFNFNSSKKVDRIFLGAAAE
jgi:hypothetical protein